ALGGSGLLAHAEDQLFEDKTGPSLMRMRTFHGQVGLDQPFVEAAGPVAAELFQPVLGLFDRSGGPVAKSGRNEGVAQAGAVASSFGLLEQAGRGSVTAEGPGNAAKQGQRMLA